MGSQDFEVFLDGLGSETPGLDYRDLFSRLGRKLEDENLATCLDTPRRMELQAHGLGYTFQCCNPGEQEGPDFDMREPDHA